MDLGVTESTKGNIWRFEKENVGNNTVIIVAICIPQYITYCLVNPRVVGAIV